MSSKHFNKEQFAEDVRVKRAKLNISMQEVADIVGVSKPTISRASKGSFVPDVHTYYALCKWLGVTMDTYFQAKPTPTSFL